MRRSAIVILLALIVAPHAGDARATTGHYEDVTCPVCGNEFEGWVWGSTNTFQRDSDFCPHALGDQVLMLEGWTCPQCLYSGFGTDFDRQTGPVALQERLRRAKLLKAPIEIDPKLKRCTLIPAWVRKDLHLQVLELREDVSARQRFWVALGAAWTQRFGVVVNEKGDVHTRSPIPAALTARFRALPPPHHREKADEDLLDRHAYERPRALARERDALDAELELTPEQRRLGLLEGAWDLKSRGDDPDADRILRRLRVMAPDLPEDERAVADMIRERLDRERHYVSLAVPLLEEVIREEEWGRDDPHGMRYLLGELYRKLGRDKDARRILEALQEDEATPAWTVRWVDRALGKIRADAD